MPVAVSHAALCNEEDWHGHDWFTLEEHAKAAETARQAMRVILALEAYKLQHGSLPKSLGELVGPYLDRLPVDPYSDQPFRYFRDGLKEPLGFNEPFWGWSREVAIGEIPANTPFIWSLGPKVRLNTYPEKKKRIVDEYYIKFPWPYYGDARRFELPDMRRPTSEYDVWSSGWPFPIP